MKKRTLILIAGLCAGVATESYAQHEYPFQNPDLPLEERVDDLIGRMTLQEKVSQMVDQAPAIERLGVPAYNWWNEALHGVARAGLATVFPQAIGLAATWNDTLIHRMATVISDEARAKHHAYVRKGKRLRYQGLTIWSPNINLFRDPRWGRGQETYGEDPFLTGALGVQFVRGLQGDDPNYLKTVYHFRDELGDPRLVAAEPMRLEAGRAYRLRVNAQASYGDAQVQLLWSPPRGDLEAEAVEAARQADAVALLADALYHPLL